MPYQPVTVVSVENGEPGVELRSVWQRWANTSTSLSDYGVKRRRNQRRTLRLREVVAKRSLELVALAS